MQSDPVALGPGVVENILGRVLEAFQARMGMLLGYALSKGFAENPAMALQMAAEPAAVLAGEPVAFFVGKATETTESFVKAVMQSGLGSGDESTETIVLMQLAQVSMLVHVMVRSLVGEIYDHAPVNSCWGGRPYDLHLNGNIALYASSIAMMMFRCLTILLQKWHLVSDNAQCIHATVRYANLSVNHQEPACLGQHDSLQGCCFFSPYSIQPACVYERRSSLYVRIS